VTETPPKLTFSGIGVYQPIIVCQHRTRNQSSACASAAHSPRRLGKVSGEHIAHMVDVGTPQRLQELEPALRSYFILIQQYPCRSLKLTRVVVKFIKHIER